MRQAVSNAVPSAWHPWQLSTEAVADQHSPLASLTFVASLLLSQALQLQLDDPHLSACVLRYLRLITAKQLLDSRPYGISMVITTAD